MSEQNRPYECGWERRRPSPQVRPIHGLAKLPLTTVVRRPIKNVPMAILRVLQVTLAPRATIDSLVSRLLAMARLNLRALINLKLPLMGPMAHPSKILSGSQATHLRPQHRLGTFNNTLKLLETLMRTDQTTLAEQSRCLGLKIPEV